MAQEGEHQVAEEKAAQAPAEYPVTRLLEESHRFFGVEPYVAAGAFHGVSKKHLTRDEAQKLIDNFAKKKVGS